MTQRVDVLLDGRQRLANQRSDNPDMWRRVQGWAQTHESVEVRRHATSRPLSVANVLFAAWSPLTALSAPSHWTIALSADPAYDAATRQVAAQARAQGRHFAVWGNQEQIGAQRISDLANEVGAQLVIYQAETQAEYASAVAAGARVIVGNPNAWTQEQRLDATGRANRGELAILFEVYTNEGAPWPEAAGAAGVPVCSEVIGVGWGQRPYRAADYKAHTPQQVWQGISVYLAEHLTDEDWRVLP